MTAPLCASCAYLDRKIGQEIRRNEALLRRDEPPRLSLIDRYKADKGRCAERGHHDTHAGPDARWHRATA